jgi:hypothetical protein
MPVASISAPWRHQLFDAPHQFSAARGRLSALFLPGLTPKGNGNGRRQGYSDTRTSASLITCDHLPISDLM